MSVNYLLCRVPSFKFFRFVLKSSLRSGVGQGVGGSDIGVPLVTLKEYVEGLDKTCTCSFIPCT